MRVHLQKYITLYFVTMLFILITIYGYLDYATNGIQNVNFSRWNDIAPVLFLFVAVLFFIVGLITLPIKPFIGMRLGWMACVSAWIFYVFMNCLMLAAFSFAIIISPKGALLYLLPLLPLSLTTALLYKERSGFSST